MEERKVTVVSIINPIARIMAATSVKATSFPALRDIWVPGQVVEPIMIEKILKKLPTCIIKRCYLLSETGIVGISCFKKEDGKFIFIVSFLFILYTHPFKKREPT
jgi:hypothetical protein